MAIPAWSAATDPTLLTIAAVTALLVGVALYRRYAAWQPSEKAIEREMRARLSAESQVRDELRGLLRQIEETSARATAELDARMTSMRELLTSADRHSPGDRRAGGLNTTSAATDASSEPAAPPEPAAPRPRGSLSEPAAPSGGATSLLESRSGDRNRAPRRRVLAAHATPPLGAAGSDKPPAKTSADDTPFADVYHLTDAGRTPIQVAQVLHRPLGEVELVLNLRMLRESDAVAVAG
ncbi:hypothetical protein RAS1_36100 [Phycisphaerae bacterium RAS1]|nr:hypothetical protein RAS1_36100 [Phycisphaerae bacterium RAS1]